jgi:hypothetical protein
MRSSVRCCLTTAGAVAGAAILASGLVAATPDFSDAGSEVRAVQLATFAVPQAAPSAALQREFVGYKGRTVAAVAPSVAGAADIATAVAAIPPTYDSAMDPAATSQQVHTAALAATTDPYADPIFGPITRYIENVVAYAYSAGSCIVQWECLVLFGWAVIPGGINVIFISFFTTVYEVIAGLLGLPTQPAASGAPTATAEPNAIIAPTLTKEPVLADSVPLPETTIDTPIRDERVTQTEPVTETQEMPKDTATSPENATETARTDEASTPSTEVNAPTSPASVSPFEATKPAGGPATPRPVVRSSLDASEQFDDLSQRDDSSRPTTSIAAASDEVATDGYSPGTSSSAASPSTSSSSSGSDSSGSDT